MNDILGIVGSQSTPSKTKTAVEVAVKAATREYKLSADVLHLANYNLDAADGRSLDEYSGDTSRALELIINSKAFVIGTPIYRGSCSGILKNLFDLIPRGKWQSDKAPLEGRAVGLIATGATDHHFLAVSQELGPIASFFGSHQVGSGVYLNASQFNDTQIVDEEAIQRLKRLGKATAELSRYIDESSYLSVLGPQF